MRGSSGESIGWARSGLKTGRPGPLATDDLLGTGWLLLDPRWSPTPSVSFSSNLRSGESLQYLVPCGTVKFLL
jgi:hypothetical protein